MPAAWSEEKDATMRVARANGATWDEIAVWVRADVKTVMRHARQLGLATTNDLAIGDTVRPPQRRASP